MLDLFDQMKEEDEKLEELEDMFYDILSENDEQKEIEKVQKEDLDDKPYELDELFEKMKSEQSKNAALKKQIDSLIERQEEDEKARTVD